MSELPSTAIRLTSASPEKSQSQRAVFFLPETYLSNIDVFAAASRKSKSEVVRLALESFFAAQGMKPEKNPRLVFEFQYD